MSFPSFFGNDINVSFSSFFGNDINALFYPIYDKDETVSLSTFLKMTKMCRFIPFVPDDAFILPNFE